MGILWILFHFLSTVFLFFLQNCHDLEKMDLEECILVTDNTLVQLSIHCPRLQALSLSHCELITDDGIRHLSSSVCGQERLQVVELDNCPLITDITLEHLKSCQRLERIELYDCQQVTRAGIKRIRAHLPEIKVHAYFAPVTPPPSVHGGGQRLCRCCVILWQRVGFLRDPVESGAVSQPLNPTLVLLDTTAKLNPRVWLWEAWFLHWVFAWQQDGATQVSRATNAKYNSKHEIWFIPYSTIYSWIYEKNVEEPPCKIFHFWIYRKKKKHAHINIFAFVEESNAVWSGTADWNLVCVGCPLTQGSQWQPDSVYFLLLSVTDKNKCIPSQREPIDYQYEQAGRGGPWASGVNCGRVFLELSSHSVCVTASESGAGSRGFCWTY